MRGSATSNLPRRRLSSHRLAPLPVSGSPNIQLAANCRPITNWSAHCPASRRSIPCHTHADARLTGAPFIHTWSWESYVAYESTAPAGNPSIVQLIAAVIVGLVLLTRGSGPPILKAQAPPCDIVCEDAKAGNPSTEWDVVGWGDPDIQGFATDMSVNRGQTVHFKISSSTGARCGRRGAAAR